MATVKDAFNLTTRTIDRRAFHYRNLVVLVVLTAFASVAWAALAWSGWPLLGLLTLMPLCGGFFFLDSLVVNRWRDEILQMWAAEGLALDIFADSIASVRLFPAGTLRAMLGTLPTKERLAAADKLPAPLKRAAALTLTTIHRRESDRTLFATFAYSLSLASVAWAIITWCWTPLLGCLSVVLVLVTDRAVNFMRWRRWLGLMRQYQKDGLDLATAIETLQRLDWGQWVAAKHWQAIQRDGLPQNGQ